MSFRYRCSPAFSRYSVTTREPGASDVLTYGATFIPFSYAFLATIPAAIITDGLDVFVHDVIAAISTSPLPICVVTVGDSLSQNSTRSGVGRLFTISISVCAFVLSGETVL